ncbi:MAG: tetratricopeptide repeat protein [Ferruginibacter sp.]|nr:tetratricopeptide repeat protein [Cytophagales bacterium]
MKRIVTLLTLLAGSLLTVPVQAQQHRIDSLERRLANAPADTNRVLLLAQLSDQYRSWGSDPHQTKRYAEQCMQLAYQLNYPFGKGKAHNAMGSYHYNGNQNPAALQHYQKALQFYQQAGRKVALAHIHANLAMVMEDMGNYTQAMENYLKSTRIAEEIDNKLIIGNNLHCIGTLMLNQKKHEEALRYLFQALPIHQRLQDHRSKTFTLNTIGVVYQERKQYDQALYYLNQSLRLSDSLGLLRGKVNCYNNLGIVHFFRQQYEEALGYYQKALALAQPQGFNQSMAIALVGMGEVYQHRGNARQAIVYYQRALQLAQTYQLVRNKLDAHQGLMQAYARLRNYDQAYLHQSKLLALKDSLFTKENDQKIAQLEASYAVEKKQAEIALLQKDRQQQIWVRNTIVAGLLVSLLVTALAVNRQRLKVRQNRLLTRKSQEVAEKNAQLEQQARVLATQAQQLNATNGQLARQSTQLEAQTHRLQQLDQVKSRFFTNISHEFRTPLTLILAPLEKLLSGRVDAPQIQRHYHLIDRHARHLLQLINQLLDFAKLEAGSLKTNPVRGDVNQRVKITTLSFESLAESKKVRLSFSSPYQSIEARFDPDTLDKILNNLLSNAFKFTTAGGRVTVALALAPDPLLQRQGAEKGWLLEIKVSDTGIGIPADEQDRVFDRFYQVDGSQPRGQPGTGIGLALVRELVELNRGTIAVGSEAGQGTQFTVRLPLAECHFELKAAGETPEAWPRRGQASPRAEASAEPLAPPAAGQGKEKHPLMLVVEDNEEVRGLIRECFQAEFRVMEAGDGVGGLKMAQKEIPDLIITDRMMPHMDGVALCHHLKTDERTSHVPVIMLTAKASEESKIEGLEMGADDYILKPFRLQELSVRVKNLIAQRKQLRERFSREVKLQPKDIAITAADEGFLHKAIGLIEGHLSDTDFSVEGFAHEIGMSRVQLHRKLKALTDQSTSEFVRTIRLKRAASLIEQRYGNIAEVMYEVGFTNVSYFASSFKKIFGVNPSEYYQREMAKANPQPVA